MSSATNTTPSSGSCECPRCRAKSGDLEQKAVFDEEDKRIGWPDFLCLPPDSPEFPIHLEGFTREQRDEVVQALVTLSKYGIGQTEITNGHAVGPLGKGRSAKQEYFSRLSTSGTEGPPDYYSAGEPCGLELVRVGANFADYEWPEHSNTPASTFNDDLIPSGGPGYPRCRAREMGAEGATPGSRVVRAFTHEMFDAYEHELGNALREMTEMLENSIYVDWTKEWTQNGGVLPAKKVRRVTRESSSDSDA